MYKKKGNHELCSEMYIRLSKFFELFVAVYLIMYLH